MTYSEVVAVGFSKLTENERKSINEAPPATPQEIQWRKGFKFVRAKRRRWAGQATVYDLNTLKKDPKLVITNRDYKRARAKEY